MNEEFNYIKNDLVYESLNKYSKINGMLKYNIIIEPLFISNYEDITTCKEKQDYKVDVILKTKQVVKIYGTARDLNSQILRGVRVFLYKEIHRGYMIDKIQDGYDITDYNGNFTFIREDIEPGTAYKVLLCI